MPNDLHLIFTPADVTLERAMQFVKGGFSYRAKKQLGMQAEIWERGMWITVFVMQTITQSMPHIFVRIQSRQGSWNVPRIIRTLPQMCGLSSTHARRG
jgi:hypothetical protein